MCSGRLFWGVCIGLDESLRAIARGCSILANLRVESATLPTLFCLSSRNRRANRFALRPWILPAYYDKRQSDFSVQGYLRIAEFSPALLQLAYCPMPADKQFGCAPTS